MVNLIYYPYICYSGREFRAIFIGTSEITYTNDDPNGHMEGEPQNHTKSVSDRYVFNTAITRSQYLVVAVGNPFLLLHIEKCMKVLYKQNAVNCWSQFMRQCLECNTFHFTDEAKELDKEEFVSLKETLYKNLFHTTTVEDVIRSDTDSDSDEEEMRDSILNAYKRELEKIPECKSAKLTLSRVNQSDLAWIMSNTSIEQNQHSRQTSSDEEDEEFDDVYECVLECQSYRKADAKPLDEKKKIVTIRGSGNRIPAFNGDTVKVGVFKDNPKDKCYGKVLDVISRGHEPRFLCRVSTRNPVIFYPIDEMNPVFCNLPRISRDLLSRRDKDAVEVELESRKDVVVFSSTSLSGNIREGKVPPIQQIIPLSIAKEMLFTVAFIQWKKAYRTPLGIVVGAMPKGFTAFSAERLLKMKHGIEYDDYHAIEHYSDAERRPDSGPLYDRVFTIDPDNAQNLDDAISLVKEHNGCASPGKASVDIYQLGVHIVNCAEHITPSADIDKEAKRRGTSVYGGKEGKIMQMLPAKTRERLSLNPNKIRDVLSVVAKVTIDANGITITDVTVEQAQIVSCVQLTYMTAQRIMDGKDFNLTTEVQLFNSHSYQPSLSETLQLLYKIALDMRLKRLKSDAAYSYNPNDPEDSDCWQAHMLIEELMIWANSTVAERIRSCYPDAALLRRQRDPNEEELSAFIEAHVDTANLSLALSDFIHDSNPECTLDQSDEIMFVLSVSVLNQIRDAISSNNMVRLVSLISFDCYHPQIAAVHAKLRSHFPRAEYCCTDSDKDEHNYRHYSLKVDNYTHFSSPLRRYLDIEVQRMLVELPGVSKVGGPPKEFGQDDHRRLCRQLNNRAQNAKQFERGLNAVDLAVKLSSSSEVYEAFIADNAKGLIELWFPQLELKYLPSKDRKLPLKFLGPYANLKEEDFMSTLTKESQTYRWKVQMTSFSAEQGKFLLNFPRLSVYKEDDTTEDSADKVTDIDMFTNDDSDPESSTLSCIKYRAKVSTPSTTSIPLNQWRKALNFVKEPTEYKMKELSKVFPQLSPISSDHNPKVSVKLSSPFINVHHQMDFKPHNVVRVWMTRSMRKSLIAPTLQMVEVSPLWRVCVQHNTHPAECFSDQNLSPASRKFYTDICEYVHLWEKVLLAEAAEKSVKDSKQVIFHDVRLEWPRLSVPSNCIDEEYYQPTGSILLTLPSNYVKNCSEYIAFNEGDLVCARYGTHPNAKVRAVFHMVIHKIECNDEEDEIEQVKLWMKFIGERNCRLSEEMTAVVNNRCELQLISISTSYQ